MLVPQGGRDIFSHLKISNVCSKTYKKNFNGFNGILVDLVILFFSFGYYL